MDTKQPATKRSASAAVEPGDEATCHQSDDIRRVGVVGAGMSGLVLATHLQESLGSKAVVTVIEWGRGAGGRTARRRVKLDNGEEVGFDHAAPFFSASSAVFQSELAKVWQAQGLIDVWKPRLGGDNVASDHGSLWVGTPSNNAVCKQLSEQVVQFGGSVLFGRHAKNARFKDGQWHLNTTNRLDGDSEELHRFDALVLSDKLLVLPNQYAVLEPDDAKALAIPDSLASTGQVVLLLVFDPPLDAPYDLIQFASGPLASLVRDSSKPGRPSTADLWTARSTSSYATRHLRGDTLDDEASVLEEMLQAFKSAVHSTQHPAFVSVFAWDHAQPSDQLAGKAFSLDEKRLLGLCGDFFQPGQGESVVGVEAASLSGLMLSKAMLPLISAL